MTQGVRERLAGRGPGTAGPAHTRIVRSIAVAAIALAVTSIGCESNAGPPDAGPIAEITFNPTLSYGTVTDVDGNAYKTIPIGTQTWMAENLKASHFSNGDVIIDASTSELWSVVGPAACEYPFDPAPNWGAIYGKLYNGHAVLDARNICPAGWHVPTNDEWTTLDVYLGGDATAVGRAIQETGTDHWTLGTYTGVTNESGLTALPGGSRSAANGDGTPWYSGQNGTGWFWSSTELNNTNDELEYWSLTGVGDGPQFNNGVYMSDGRHGNEKYMGLSVRCLMD